MTYQAQLADEGTASARIVLLGPDGTALIDTARSRDGKTYARELGALKKINLLSARNPAALGAKSGQTGAVAHGSATVGYAPSKPAYDYPGLDWLALVSVPEGKLAAAWRTLLAAVGLTMLVSVVAIGGLGFLMANGIARPIIAMAEVMRRIAGGEKSLAVPHEERRDEIGTMAHAVAFFRDKLGEVDALGTEQQQKAQAEARHRQALTESAAGFQTHASAILHTVDEASNALTGSADTVAANAAATREEFEERRRRIGAHVVDRPDGGDRRRGARGIDQRDQPAGRVGRDPLDAGRVSRRRRPTTIGRGPGRPRRRRSARSCASSTTSPARPTCWRSTPRSKRRAPARPARASRSSPRR